jgi:hypothetical protein
MAREQDLEVLSSLQLEIKEQSLDRLDFEINVKLCPRFAWL